MSEKGFRIGLTPRLRYDEHSGQVDIADGGSELMRDVFGEANMSCRLIFGVSRLPVGVPIELEVIFEVQQ